MRGAALRNQDSSAKSDQDRIIRWMRRLGIEVDSTVWVYRDDAAHQQLWLTRKRLDWAKFLVPLSECLPANPHLPSILRWLSACWLTGCGGEFKPAAFVTVRCRLLTIRRVLARLLASGDSLETLTPRQVQQVVSGMFLDSQGRYLRAQTVYQIIHTVRDLYRLRSYLPSALRFDPFPPAFARSVYARGRRSQPWSAPPEAVCLELIREAIRWLGPPADDVIRLRDRYILACESAKRRYPDRKRVKRVARQALRGERFGVLAGERRPWTDLQPRDTVGLKRMVAAIEGACAAVLLFLSGPRVSELARAGPGCLRHVRHANGIKYPYFFAERSKRNLPQPGADSGATDASNDRGWILGPAGVRALEVLEQLSRLPRRLSGFSSYWLSIRCSGLWTCTHRTRLAVISPELINNRLNVFASIIGLAKRTGWQGHLHSHMGRKACARFIAKRDRTALADLALQFGHLSAYVTDTGYARPDTEYRRLIQEELADEMQEVAAELAAIDVGHIFSHMHTEAITALRDRATRFVGQLRSSQEIRRMLGHGVRLVPCDWGMCVFREQTSLCGGNQYGPSAERRSPSVCRQCINFVATNKHLPFWRRRATDCERALLLRGLPEQTRRLVRARLSEAQEVIIRIKGGLSR